MSILSALGHIDRAPKDRIIPLKGIPVTKRKTKDTKQKKQVLKDEADAKEPKPKKQKQKDQTDSATGNPNP
jgi:hypothetical protein